MKAAGLRSRILFISALLPLSFPVLADGNPEQGEKVYDMCLGCHSLEPGRHRAGPSLVQIFGQEAGTVPGFTRYSQALKQSKIVWNEETLDAWIKEPDNLVPGNLMPFPGISDPQKRADLVAFLKAVSKENRRANVLQTGGGR